MPTKISAGPIVLFLFAHQDDEFGVFQAIQNEGNKNHRICCAYLTDGQTKTANSALRNKESISVLTQLGVKESDICFVGEMLGISDGTLPENMYKASQWLMDFLATVQVRAIYVPAWEGGHHDHDALHAITTWVSHQMGRLGVVQQYPLYNGYHCVGKLFRVLLPIKNNGAVQTARIPLANRFRFLKFCLSYPSQKNTWMGLFPFVAMHYIFWGTQQLQNVTIDRILQRPHSGSLYYERRDFFTWEQMAAHVSDLISIN